MTPDAFRSAHGDSTTWSAADFEGYEHMLEAASPVYAAAAASGRIIVAATPRAARSSPTWRTGRT